MTYTLLFQLPTTTVRIIEATWQLLDRSVFLHTKLIPPNEYAARKQTWIDQDLAVLLERRLLQFGIFSAEDEGTLAAGRYANEQWVGSHPHVIPCDVSPDKTIGHWQSQDRDASDFVFSVAPRHEFVELLNSFYKTKRRKARAILADDRLRLRDYSLLGGTIARWQGLYNNTTPPSNSWVWKSFPDATVWHEAIEKHGSDAVAVVGEAQLS